jgi:hypothetical protein
MSGNNLRLDLYLAIRYAVMLVSGLFEKKQQNYQNM